jgi:hypothetical protein
MAATTLRAVLSYRVAMPRGCRMRQTVSSMALRSVYRLMSCGLGIVRDEALGMTAAVSRSAWERQSSLAS